MSARLLRPAIAVAVVLLVGLGMVAACSRNDPPESADDTTAETTAISAPSTPLPTEDPNATSTTGSVDPNASSTSTTEEEETDAFGHTAAETAALRAAYNAAYEGECRRIWASVGGGALADPDFAEDTYVLDDCLIELDPEAGDLNDTVEEAATTGTYDAQSAASDLADPLCSIVDTTLCWSYDG